MKPSLISLALAMALAGCAHSGGSDGGIVSTRNAVNGEAAYLEHCAGCHETGMLGAPREGEPGDWQARSTLWQAVLLDHARTGYFDMPAKGGKADLPDDIVEAAAEYMLEQTFPDRPKD